jgi:hypothetical protein
MTKESNAINLDLIDQLLADYKSPEDVLGENGLLKQLTKAVLERALKTELTHHLGRIISARRSTTPQAKTPAMHETANPKRLSKAISALCL